MRVILVLLLIWIAIIIASGLYENARTRYAEHVACVEDGGRPYRGDDGTIICMALP